MKVDYDKYADICRQAVTDNRVFDTFKSHPSYTYMLEHVNEIQGALYLEEIIRHTPDLMSLMSRFETNDDIGNPNMFYYANIGLMSPTTLRYIKVLSDLIMIFETPGNLDIVEVGVGYGGQCKIIHDYCTPKSYTLVDLPEVLALAKKCNEKQGLRNIIYKTSNELELSKYDLFISNYAFTEIGRKYQELYKEKLIDNSRMGYITCNYFGLMTKEEAFTKDEILSMRNSYTILAEKPLTSPNNFIYTWS